MHRGWTALAVAHALALATVVAIACSGKTTGDTGDAGNGGGTDSGLVSGCPAAAPAAGAACSTIGLECEYGSDVALACDTLARCDASGWTVTPPATHDCPTPPNAPTCPATYASVPAGSTCSTAASCAYGEGTCSCEVYCGPQYPVGHVCEAGTPMTWQCTGAASGCPAERPRVGASCTTEGQSCQYGDCNTTAERCTNGAWRTQPTGCPISTARVKQGVRYLTGEERRAVADETLHTRLATYEYKLGDPDPRLGFIIEDQPTESPAVVRGKDRVDLYGYTSMTVATLQVQSEEIAELRRQVEELRREVTRCAAR